MRDYKAIGLKAKAANLKRDPDHYSKIGKKGGQTTRDRGHLEKIGFKANPELARIAGKKGGEAGKGQAKNNHPKRAGQ